MSNEINVFNKLYPYQKDAVTTTLYNPKGIVCMPTGVGKTYCQAAIIANDIIMNPNQFRMYVINAPRIILTFQLLKEVYGFLTQGGIEARYAFVHSGGKTNESELEEMRTQANAMGYDIPFSEIGSGTSIAGIREMMFKSKEQDLPLIMFSTYHSAHRIEEARLNFFKQELSIVLNDEAHYLVQEQFHEILNKLKTSRCYFFTATQINTPSNIGRGMNNKGMYGKNIYTMIPREAIELGKMVRPRLHFVRTNGIYNTDDYNRSLNKIIKSTFEQHEAVLNKTNQNPKILVSTKGTQDIVGFIGSTEYNELRASGVSVYAVASNPLIGNNIDTVNVSRQEFLKRLKVDGSDKSKKLIVLHYDILAEGIDVSGFTGIMPLRTLNKSKFLQTFGRSARLDNEDRIKIDSGEITVHDLDKMNKPYSYIMIPNIIHSNEDDKENLTQLITELRSYGFNPAEDIVSSSIVNGVPEVEDIEGLNNVVRRIPNAGVLIEDLEAELEAEVNAKLSKVDYLKNKYGNKS